MIVGGFAVMKYGEPRHTKDLDLWIHNSEPNSLQLIKVLKKFGAPLDNDGIIVETFSEKRVVYQIGIAPARIDLMTEITGVDFVEAWKNRVPSTFFGCGAFHFPGSYSPTGELAFADATARQGGHVPNPTLDIKYLIVYLNTVIVTYC